MGESPFTTSASLKAFDELFTPIGEHLVKRIDKLGPLVRAADIEAETHAHLYDELPALLIDLHLIGHRMMLGDMGVTLVSHFDDFVVRSP
ncbi:hypothetical protein D3C72_1344860 [compost metagenome]